MQKLLDVQAQLESTGIEGRDVTFTAQEGFLKIVDADMPNYPVFLTVSDDVMVCWANIVKVSDIPEVNQGVLASALLTANDVCGLSTFSLGDGYFKLQGKLSSTSTQENVVLELDSLFSTIEDSLEVFVEFAE